MLFASGCDDSASDEKYAGSENNTESDVEDAISTDPGTTDETPADEDTGASAEDVLDTSDPGVGPANDTGDEVESDDVGEGADVGGDDDSDEDEDVGEDEAAGEGDDIAEDAGAGEGDDLAEDDGAGDDDEAVGDDGVFIPDWPEGTDPFGDVVVSFDPGPDAGFGEEGFPDIVLGSPHGTRGGGGSLHVLSLGERGSIVIEFTDLGIIDGPGADLLVFENPFPTWSETGVVEVSND